MADVAPREIPVRADLAWASFPCQDLSLAGVGAGLDGERSGAFWPFWRLMRRLGAERRGPRLIALENVCGCVEFARRRGFLRARRRGAGERLPLRRARDRRGGVHAAIAAAAVPACRRRGYADPPVRCLTPGPPSWGVSPALLAAHARLDAAVAARFLWSRLPPPPRRNFDLVDLVEDRPRGVEWQNPDGVARLLSLMAPLHRARVTEAISDRKRRVGALYRRTRPAPDGGKAQRAEVRFDGVAGCLRTPAGGSSRQTILVVEHGEVRARLLSAREAARLMGLPDSYALPERYNEAYHLLGDGVVAPIVRHLAAHWMEPILKP